MFGFLRRKKEEPAHTLDELVERGLQLVNTDAWADFIRTEDPGRLCTMLASEPIARFVEVQLRQLLTNLHKPSHQFGANLAGQFAAELPRVISSYSKKCRELCGGSPLLGTPAFEAVARLSKMQTGLRNAAEILSFLRKKEEMLPSQVRVSLNRKYTKDEMVRILMEYGPSDVRP